MEIDVKLKNINLRDIAWKSMFIKKTLTPEILYGNRCLFKKP